MGWLIDTSIWIAVERGTLAAADIHAITRQDPVYLSPVNVAEIRFGLDVAAIRSAEAASHRDASPAPPKTPTEDHRRNGRDFRQPGCKTQKGRKRSTRSVNDLWLAAQAIQRDFRLLTSNAKDFADVPGLQMVVLKLP